MSIYVTDQFFLIARDVLFQLEYHADQIENLSVLMIHLPFRCILEKSGIFQYVVSQRYGYVMGKLIVVIHQTKKDAKVRTVQLSNILNIL